MPDQDLLPERYRQALASGRALRVWAPVVALCGLLSAGAVVSSATHREPVAGAAAAEQIAMAERRALASQEQARELGQELALQRRAASAVDAVAVQPDWRGLIERVSVELGDQVVLTQCRFGPMQGAQLARPADSDTEGAVWLELGGVAADYAQVPALVLRLEAMGLFVQVQLLETGRQAFAGEPRISFRIACRVQ